MVQVNNLNIKIGGDAISAVDCTTRKSINTRTKYVLIGSDFSQQERPSLVY
jgi:hypothetical protein